MFNTNLCSLLQLDANLIEGEPCNRLAQLKIKDDYTYSKVAQQNSNIPEIRETGFQSPLKGAQSGVIDTQIFVRPLFIAP